MNTTINRQQWQEEEALRRFQLISPLLQTGLDDAKRIQLRKKIAEENNISVRSLYRYEKAFSERQFTGLKPADRDYMYYIIIIYITYIRMENID